MDHAGILLNTMVYFQLDMPNSIQCDFVRKFQWSKAFTWRAVFFVSIRTWMESASGNVGHICVFVCGEDLAIEENSSKIDMQATVLMLRSIHLPMQESK